MKFIFIIPALAIALVSCSVGPDYVKPQFRPPANYKTNTSSQLGVSSSWWKAFRDPTLNSLQSQLLAQNLDLQIAQARHEQALAQLGITRTATFPKSNASGGVSRRKTSRAGADPADAGEYFSLYEITGSLSYEIDLWGRVRRLVEAGKADAGSAGYAFADAKVSLQTQLARHYFALRFLDAEMYTLSAGVKTRQANLKIANDRHRAGLNSELDTARAESELAKAKADLLSLKGPRAQLENSIAVLLGRQPSSFRISKRSYHGNLPRIPAGVPAALLCRRPDIAIAERQLAAATARIGVAQAERFPKFSLTGKGGSSSISTSKFIEQISQVYSFGPSVSVPIFEGGKIKSGILQSKAKQKEALANFQKVSLRALADVESSLANLKALRAEAGARNTAVKSTQRTFDLSLELYKEGTTSYLEVADAEREKLTTERAAVRTRGRQFAATVQLIQALGGGFNKGGK